MIVDLSANDIGDEGARALERGLRQNNVLCELTLTGNAIGDFEAEGQINDHLERNRAAAARRERGEL